MLLYKLMCIEITDASKYSVGIYGCAAMIQNICKRKMGKKAHIFTV